VGTTAYCGKRVVDIELKSVGLRFENAGLLDIARLASAVVRSNRLPVMTITQPLDDGFSTEKKVLGVHCILTLKVEIPPTDDLR
jgi:hypothetical protein